MSTSIYYFTGTGNSLKIAKDLRGELKDTKLVRICKNNMQIKSDTESDKIGFVFPVYYRGLPYMVRKFVENLEINKNTYFFAVANYGSYAALSFEQLNNILMDKSAKLSAVFGIPMPGNMWFMYYPHPKQDVIDRINAEKERAINIAKKISNRDIIQMEDIKNKDSEEKIYNNFQPNDIDQDFWANEKCNGCGVCSKVCPANNIRIIDKKPVWRHQCEECLACIHWCPKQSIEYKNDSLNKERYNHPDIKVQELFQEKLS